jgi:hypothetical protein
MFDLRRGVMSLEHCDALSFKFLQYDILVTFSRRFFSGRRRQTRDGRHPLRRRRTAFHPDGGRLDEDGLERQPPQVGPGRVRRPQADPLRGP